MSGIIYFIQPVEFLGTNIYKIGCSGKNNMVRCKTGYKSGTDYILIMKCADPFEVEKELIARFSEKFRL